MAGGDAMEVRQLCAGSLGEGSARGRAERGLRRGSQLRHNAQRNHRASSTLAAHSGDQPLGMQALVVEDVMVVSIS